MIDYLRLQNFQGCVASRLDFLSGINSIIGPTDAGKSTFIRALRWIAQNRPSGDSNTRHGETECRAQLGSHGQKATRTRTPTENSYTLASGDQKPRTFKAIGQSVPEDVTKALRLADVNFQFQMDGPFWFSLSAGERCREFNAIVDLSAIDVALSRLGTLARKQQTAVEIGQERVAKAVTAIKAVEHAPRAEVGLRNLEKLETGSLEADGRLGRLAGLMEAAREAGDSRRGAERRLAGLQSVEVTGITSRDAEARVDALQGLLGRIERLESGIKVPPAPETAQRLLDLRGAAEIAAGRSERLAELLQFVRDAQAKAPKLPKPERLEALRQLRVDAEGVRARVSALQEYLGSVAEMAASVAAASKSLKQVEKELESIPVCPTCGKPTGGV